MEIILKYFDNLTAIQKNQFTALFQIYSDWNSKINVISRKDIDQLYLRHVLHSLAIAKYISFSPHTKIMDAGTGGGFPGIPLAIMFPESRFLLVDSIGKKITVVEDICKNLNLTNCLAVQARCEDIQEKFDFVVSRAVTNLPEFIGWVKNSITRKSKNSLPNGIISLKGGDLSLELEIPYQTNVKDISDYFNELFFETKKIVHVQI